MDAFFASVEELDKPWLRGSPVVIGADPAGGFGRGVVSTANYLARAYGIHSAMPIRVAWRASQDAKKQGKPEVIFLGSSFARYEEISEAVNAIIASVATFIERAGIDESYADFSACGTFLAARALGRKLKKLIKQKTGLTASVGIAPNKLVAKIASDMEKPDGLTVIAPEDVLQALENLAIRKIPGVGPKTENLLLRQGVRTVRDARAFSEDRLVKLFGKWGKELYQKVHGIDDTPLEGPATPKSVGEQETFEADVSDFKIILKTVSRIAEEVFDRLRTEGFTSWRRVTVTVRFEDFETKTRSETSQIPLSTKRALEMRAVKLVFPFFDRRENPASKKFRLLGVRVEKLSQ